MREGAEYFTDPAGAAQRRYEALRAYFLDEMPAAEVADRFGYSTASVHQMATLLRSGRMRLFADARPGRDGSGARFAGEADRRQAIALAIQEAQHGDIVLIAGKGHEKVQITREGSVPFDDVEVARTALHAAGYVTKENVPAAGGVR